MNTKPELLAPAGNFENAFFALKYGADAIYQGLSGFSLRRTTKAELDIDDMVKCVDLAHSLGKKHYLAINIFAHEQDVTKLRDNVLKLKTIKTDAFIVSDPGIFLILKENFPTTDIHLSTQSNTLNSASVNFWHNQGISRIILARELTKEEIISIKTSSSIGLEMFVHGAMCMSYSGRCHLSNYFLNRDANKGECAQPCRWEYLQKAQIPASTSQSSTLNSQFIEIEEDARGTYILNSKDLCLIEKIPELIDIGINSFKIEGRNKTSYYVANVVRVYRQVIDESLQGVLSEQTLTWAKQELVKVSHRDYSTGFYDGERGSFNFASSGYIKDASMVGIASSEGDGGIVIEVRDKIEEGDEIDFIFPGNKEITLKIQEMKDLYSNKSVRVAHNRMKVVIPLNIEKIDNIIIRKKR